MAKGKETKKPKRKHLVVVDPWTTNDEAISAWFTVMMKEHYPYAQVNSIYYRSSTNNKIVELSKDVDDLSYFLGAHHHRDFLTDRPKSDRISYVYEWKREGQEKDPGERQWLQMFPKNGPIPPHFPIKDPYPPQVIIGLPGQGAVPTYAHPISPALQQRITARMLQNLEKAIIGPTNAAASTSSTCSALASSSRIPPNVPSSSTCGPHSTPYASSPRHSEPPQAISPRRKSMDFAVDHRFASRVENAKQEPVDDYLSLSTQPGVAMKMDPYQEADVAEEQLRSPSPIIKMDEAEDFLGSLFPSVKGEFKPPIIPEDEDSHPHVPGDDYKPSAELLALFGTLAEAGNTHVFVKPEPTETSIPDYQPSADLLKAFALLSDNVDSINGQTPVKREQEDEPYTPSQVFVKQEASEISTYELSAMHPQKPKTLQRHVEPPTRQARSLDPRLNTRPIKSETFEHSNHPHSRPPLDQQPSRDPRIRALNKRNGDHLRGHVEPPKRIKSEYEG